MDTNHPIRIPGYALLWLLLMGILTQPAFAEKHKKLQQASELDQAMSYYVQLRDEDSEVKRPKEWEKAAARLSDFLDLHPKDSTTPTVLLQLGRLFEQLYRKQQSQASLSRAAYFYERLPKDFDGHPLADDALLSLGDLRREAMGDAVAARAAYYEIVDRYANGDKVSEATKRLAGLGSQKSGVRSQKKEGSLESGVGSEKRENTVVTEDTAEKEQPKIVLRAKSEGREIFSQQSERARPLIVIDPGHGGEDLGAVGVDGIIEKDIVLNIAFYLDELLRERLRARTILTRARDQVVSLADRTKIANDKNANLFISIHANASPNKTLHGLETYYLDNTHDQSSLKLAERENQSLHYGQANGDLPQDLQFILSDMIQDAKLEDSISLAHYVDSSLYQNLSRYYEGIKDYGVKKAPFYVLVGAHMPCILVEVSFIDHPVEGARLGERTYQKLIAESLYRGIRSFFEKTAH